ncbi:hypothetical protein PIB30_039575 [Stylosanthes scabra]|uniref:Uncharacterized protein n=1 Tax=Stylosanthes scabra TaxID=79078 RepID=A0ABU6WCR3_9FABA|nr:hypothetical protein [Stylosanthes scabra]
MSRHSPRGIRCFSATTTKASPPERACQTHKRKEIEIDADVDSDSTKIGYTYIIYSENKEADVSDESTIEDAATRQGKWTLTNAWVEVAATLEDDEATDRSYCECAGEVDGRAMCSVEVGAMTAEDRTRPRRSDCVKDRTMSEASRETRHGGIKSLWVLGGEAYHSLACRGANHSTLLK